MQKAIKEEDWQYHWEYSKKFIEPALKHQDSYTIEDIEDKRYNGEPRWGDCDFRNGICLTWNTYMKKLCDENGVSFISIYDRLVDENNITKQEYFKDYCHIIYDIIIPS